MKILSLTILAAILVGAATYAVSEGAQHPNATPCVSLDDLRQGFEARGQLTITVDNTSPNLAAVLFKHIEDRQFQLSSVYLIAMSTQVIVPFDRGCAGDALSESSEEWKILMRDLQMAALGRS